MFYRPDVDLTASKHVAFLFIYCFYNKRYISLTVIANTFIIFEKKGFVLHRYSNITAQAINTAVSQHRQPPEPIEIFIRRKVHKQRRIEKQYNHTQKDRQLLTT
jgi:hypothetical protein